MDEPVSVHLQKNVLLNSQQVCTLIFRSRIQLQQVTLHPVVTDGPIEHA